MTRIRGRTGGDRADKLRIDVDAAEELIILSLGWGYANDVSLTGSLGSVTVEIDSSFARPKPAR